MYHHVKKLMYTVRVDEPDPRFGNMLLEQFGGANGELAAAMQYSIQGLNCEDPDRKDLLMDIGTEELSHLEVVGCLARLHLKPTKFDREKAEADPLIAIAVAKFGGRYLARGARPEVLEGGPAHNMLIIEFDSAEVVRQWYRSPEYAAAKAARQGASNLRLVLVDSFVKDPNIAR